MDSEKAKPKRKLEKKRKRTEDLNISSNDLTSENDDLQTDVSRSKTSAQEKQKKQKRENDTSDDDTTSMDTSNESSDKMVKSKKQLEKERLKEEAKRQKLVQEKVMQKIGDLLDMWKTHKTAWKSEKLKEIWLMDNMPFKCCISDEILRDVLNYFKHGKGLARKMLLHKAIEVVREVYQEKDNEKRHKLRNLVVFKRAIMILENVPNNKYYRGGL